MKNGQQMILLNLLFLCTWTRQLSQAVLLMSVGKQWILRVSLFREPFYPLIPWKDEHFPKCVPLNVLITVIKVLRESTVKQTKIVSFCICLTYLPMGPLKSTFINIPYTRLVCPDHGLCKGREPLRWGMIGLLHMSILINELTPTINQ